MIQPTRPTIAKPALSRSAAALLGTACVEAARVAEQNDRKAFELLRQAIQSVLALHDGIDTMTDDVAVVPWPVAATDMVQAQRVDPSVAPAAARPTPSPNPVTPSLSTSPPTPTVHSAPGVALTDGSLIVGLRALAEQLETLVPTGAPRPSMAAEVDERRPSVTSAVSGPDQALNGATAASRLGTPRPRSTIESIELVASPIRTFGSMTGFHAAVRRLRGVVEARATAFERGTLTLAVRYADALPFAGRLIELAEFDLRLVAVAGHRIEVAVD